MQPDAHRMWSLSAKYIQVSDDTAGPEFWASWPANDSVDGQFCAIALHMVRRCASDSHAPFSPRPATGAHHHRQHRQKHKRRGSVPNPLQNDMQMQLTKGRKNLGCN